MPLHVHLFLRLPVVWICIWESSSIQWYTCTLSIECELHYSQATNWLHCLIVHSYCSVREQCLVHYLLAEVSYEQSAVGSSS